jgi:hypothetical protein
MATSPVRGIPPEIQGSRLMSQGGFAVYEGLVNRELFGRLLEESFRLYEHAQENREPISDQEVWRGGNPARQFLSVGGGDVQAAFYQSPEILGILIRLSGVTIRPTGGKGTFSYYARPGDYLAIHRDIEKCDLAVITCLYETYSEGTAGKLALYPRRLSEPLPAIRATPTLGYLPQLLLPGQTIILFGGIVPHQILPVAQGQVRIVSILCYEAIIQS